MRINLALFLGYTLGSVCGLVLLKTHLGLARDALNGTLHWGPLFFVGLGAALYICGFLLWLGILSRMELSIAYPIAIGLTLVFSSLASWFLLSEPISLVRIMGTLLIFVGIVVIARS
ncbi:EamA family transporter [Amorphus coralli]|uniref:EamA family transporter n=1 Tax=Amorphus coralli TaxID=340680 RepID=UPI000377695F|nr:EamA family transporter [Amorphus coralli]